MPVQNNQTWGGGGLWSVLPERHTSYACCEFNCRVIVVDFALTAVKIPPPTAETVEFPLVCFSFHLLSRALEMSGILILNCVFASAL